jgi:hypothetical protein
VVVVVAVGCSTRSPDPQPRAGSAKVVAPAPSPAAAPEPPARDPAKGLAAKADQALADNLKLDDTRPFADVAIDRDREPVRTLYFQACQAGDHRSCWMAMELAVSMGADAREAEAKVKDHCRAGDVMSCRALELYSSVDGDPAHVKAAVECEAGRSCDRAALRRECKAGYPIDCVAVVTHDERAPDQNEFAAIGRKLARDGCKLSVLEECNSLKLLSAKDDPQTRADYLSALEQTCTIGLSGCKELARAYLGADAAKARDAYERSCRFEIASEPVSGGCELLWRAYTDPGSGITEPVPGHAKQLHDWACTQHKKCWR